jgi:formate hydrogenlyase subunit 6/NADH:ubiquinone oxidoreductase subunit I
MIGELLKGLATTFKHFLKPPVTIQYPEVKRPVRHRFKGRHELKRYDNGLEKVHRLLALCGGLPGRRDICGGGGKHG